MKSIVQNDFRCFLCHSERNLEVHHCIHGTANRKLADEDGLTVLLCNECHRMLHDHGQGDKVLQQIAQQEWERHNGTTEDFIKRYGKSYK